MLTNQTQKLESFQSYHRTHIMLLPYHTTRNEHKKTVPVSLCQYYEAGVAYCLDLLQGDVQHRTMNTAGKNLASV